MKYMYWVFVLATKTKVKLATTQDELDLIVW